MAMLQVPPWFDTAVGRRSCPCVTSAGKFPSLLRRGQGGSPTQPTNRPLTPSLVRRGGFRNSVQIRLDVLLHLGRRLPPLLHAHVLGHLIGSQIARPAEHQTTRIRGGAAHVQTVNWC